MSFKDIKGQDKAIRALKSYVSSSRLAGAYLFIGPQGVGKSFAARQLAKALNCSSEGFDSCDTCLSCLKIDKGQHPDVHIIDTGSSEVKIEYIRQLQRDISLRPYEARIKVFIICNAHNLNPSSANALLKTLEEPTASSLVILITEKPSLLFKTIVSRCQIVKFSALPREELEDILIKDYDLKPQPAHFLAYYCEGRFGRALSLKDADILTDKNKIIDEFIVSSPHAASRSVQERQDIRNNLNMLATWFRDIYLAKIGLPHKELINLDRKDELLGLVSSFTFEQLDEIMKNISSSLLYLDQNINTRLLLTNLKLSLRIQVG